MYAINPMSVARYRERHSTSGAKSDAADEHVLAEIVRLDHAHHRPVTGDSAPAEAMKLVARTHQTLIWDRSRQLLRLRSALREFFPAALHAFDDLTAPDALELLGRAADPDRAVALSRSQIAAALRRANPPRRRRQGCAHAGAAARQRPVPEAAFVTVTMEAVSALRLVGGLSRSMVEHPENINWGLSEWLSSTPTQRRQGSASKSSGSPRSIVVEAARASISVWPARD